MADLLSYNNALSAYKASPDLTAYNNVLNIANQSGQTKSSPNNSGGNSGGNNYTTGNYDPTTLSQSQRQSLWEANGHSGTAPDGYGGEGGNNQADQAAKMEQEVIDAIKAANDQYNAGVSAYDKAHPFNQDDILAQEAAKAKGTVSQYYDQLLGDYMTGVDNLKGNTIQDEMRTATLLQADRDAFVGQNKALLDTTLNQVGQDYAGQGGYDSGARARAQGIQEANAQYANAQEQRQYEYNQSQNTIQANRVLNQQIPLATTIYQQQQARDKTADTSALEYQNYNYDAAQNNYLRGEAGVANVQNNGGFQAGGAFPGESYANTQQTLQSELPSVSGNAYGLKPIYAYG